MRIFVSIAADVEGQERPVFGNGTCDVDAYPSDIHAIEEIGLAVAERLAEQQGIKITSATVLFINVLRDVTAASFPQWDGTITLEQTTTINGVEYPPGKYAAT